MPGDSKSSALSMTNKVPDTGGRSERKWVEGPSLGHLFPSHITAIWSSKLPDFLVPFPTQPGQKYPYL